jgi:hypothetical protein
MVTDRSLYVFKIQVSNQIRIFKMVNTKYILTFIFCWSSTAVYFIADIDFNYDYYKIIIIKIIAQKEAKNIKN